MKTLTLSLCLLMTAFLFSCDPHSDKKVGDADRFGSTPTPGGGSGTSGGSGGTGTSTGSGNSPTDAPLDGGLAVLLAAGAAYGIKKVRGQKPKEQA